MLILGATQNPQVGRWIQRHGMRFGADRFVAGETVEDCVAVLRELDSRNLRSYAVALGESLTEPASILRTIETYRTLIERLAEEGTTSTISLKLTNLGVASDEESAFRHAREIIGRAAEHGIFARIDMEESRWVDVTLNSYRRLREEGFDNTGVVLQAYLYRTLADLEALRDYRPNVRVVKGAYLEPASVAHPRKEDVDRNYLRLIDASLECAGFTAIATHDDQAITYAESRLRSGEEAADYEFQLLLGVRPSLQSELAARDHPVRVCVPFGEEWFIYLGRRLAERPANLLFLLSNLVRR
jgi:proline dehydrogenase